MLTMSTRSSIRLVFAIAVIGATAIAVVATFEGNAGAAGSIGDAAGVSSCNAVMATASEYGTVTGLARAETSTAGLVAHWQENQGRSGLHSAFRNLPVDQTVTVCLLSGQFVTPVGPPDPTTGKSRLPHNVLRLLIYGNPPTVVVEGAGYKGSMFPETPSDLR
jgi:hypothetical protein